MQFSVVCCVRNLPVGSLSKKTGQFQLVAVLDKIELDNLSLCFSSSFLGLDRGLYPKI